jgi:hypothetical protein
MHGRGSGVIWPRRLRATCHAGEPSEHRTEAVAKREHGADLLLRREAENDDRLESSGCFRSLTSRAAEARHAVVTLPARCLGDAEKRREQRATELVRQGGVAAGQPSGDGIAEPKRIAGDVKSVEAMVIERSGRAAHLGMVIDRPCWAVA